MPNFDKIPLCVVTGFLGSGKTTIIKNLLQLEELRSTAVIINEFGDIGLDHQLIETSNEDLIELSTGCLCCVMRGDLQEAINRLLKKRSEGWLFDRIILETTGLADPAPIMQSLVIDQDTGSKVSLDRVLVTIDAVTGLKSIIEFEESRRQIALADVLLITKTDISDEDIEVLKRKIRSVNSSATISITDNGNIDLRVILGAKKEIPDFIMRKELQKHHHSHDDIISVSYRSLKPISAVTLTLFLELLAETLGPNLIRLKGMVLIKESPETPAVVHGVQHIFHPVSWYSKWPNGKKETKLVLIGKRMTLTWIEALLETIEEEVEELTRHKTS